MAGDPSPPGPTAGPACAEPGRAAAGPPRAASPGPRADHDRTRSGEAARGAGRGAAVKETLRLDRVIIRFAGDSGDGMQLTGDRFTSETASFGNDLSTLP
ncbi:2-oxoglutarate ferredoxin oxidoreductase subunit alpha, partial [Streptomyces sp. NPDC056982]